MVVYTRSYPLVVAYWQGVRCGLDRVGKPGDLRKGQGIQRHTSPANHRIPHFLDVLSRKKIRWWLAKGFSFGSVLVARAAAKVDIAAVGAVVVVAVAAAKVVDRLAGEGFGGEACSGNNDLAVPVLVSGSSGGEFSHFLVKLRAF
jgi:hypothetical protein